MNPEKKRLCKGIMCVIGAVLIHFTYGHFYTIANMVPYIVSYSKKVDPKVNENLKIWLSALALGIQGVTMPLGGFLATKINFRIVIAISCILESGGVLLTAYVITKSFVGVLITYSLIKGAGLGLGYSVVMAVASAWFPKRRGLIVGLIVGGFGLGSLIFTPIQTAYINPDNKQAQKTNYCSSCFTDKALLDRVPTAFLILGGILLGLQIIGFCLLRSAPKKEPDEEELNENEEEYQSKEKEFEEPKIEEEENVYTRELFRRVDFYLLWLVMFCNVIPITIITATYKTFGHTYIKDDRYLSTIVTVSAVFNAGGRIVWGAIVDRISFKIPLFIMLGLWAVVLITFAHIKTSSDGANKALFAIWAFLMYICLSGVFSIMPAATGTLFGPANLAVNYGLIFAAFAAGSVLCGLITTFVVQEDPYLAQFTGCGCVCIVALILAIWIRDRKMNPRANICRTCERQCPNARGPRADDYDEYYEDY